MKNLIKLLVVALVLGCGSQQDIVAQDPNVGNTETGYVSADAGVVSAPLATDLGQATEALTLQAGVLNALMPSPFGQFLENAAQPIFRQCGTGNGSSPNPTNGVVGCAGRNLLSAPARFFNIATNSGDFQPRLQAFCNQMATKIAWQCNVSFFTGQVCPAGVAVCVRNTSVVTGGTPYPVFDMRRYQKASCPAPNTAHATTFRGVSYSNARCDFQEYTADKAVMQGEAGSSYSQLANDVMYSIGMQAIGVGLTGVNEDHANSATFSVGSFPYLARSKFMLSGEICRANAYLSTEDGTLHISDGSGCNDDL